MADDIDRAQQIVADSLARALANRLVFAGESAAVCIHCGNDIPEARRKALPGIQICVECARAHESRAKQHTRQTLCR